MGTVVEFEELSGVYLSSCNALYFAIPAPVSGTVDCCLLYSTPYLKIVNDGSKTVLSAPVNGDIALETTDSGTYLVRLKLEVSCPSSPISGVKLVSIILTELDKLPVGDPVLSVTSRVITNVLSPSVSLSAVAKIDKVAVLEVIERSFDNEDKLISPAVTPVIV